MLPLLHLPIPAFDCLYKFFDVPDIILLAQCSKRLKTIIRDQEGPRNKRILCVTIHREQMAITVQEDKMNPKKKFSWSLGGDSDDLELVDGDIMIDNTPWKVAKVTDGFYNGFLSVMEPDVLESSFLALLGVFQSVFKIPVHRVHYDFRSDANFAKLFKETAVLRGAKKIEIGPSAIFPPEMSFILEHFTTDNLTIQGYSGRKYSYNGPLNYSKFRVHCATWMTPEAFLTLASTCKQMELESAIQISDNALNQFVKNWMAGENKTLEFIKVSRNLSYHITNFRSVADPTAPFETQVIMEGIKYALGVKKRPDAAKNFNSFYKYENGLDIRRADGLMATVLVEREHFSAGFVFTVWNDKEPNLVEGV